MARINICVFGDSIYAGVENVGGFLWLRPVADLIRFQINCDITNLAVGSTKYSHALTYWNGTVSGAWGTMTAERRAAFDYIYVTGYHNGEDIPTAQLLVNQINIDKKPSAKIITTTLCPSSDIPLSQFTTFNEAIQGLGASPLTGFDHCVTGHSNFTNDPTNPGLQDPLNPGKLASQFWTSAGDQIHTNYQGKDIVADYIVMDLKSRYGITV